jgi:hypothetical protein
MHKHNFFIHFLHKFLSGKSEIGNRELFRKREILTIKITIEI